MTYTEIEKIISKIQEQDEFAYRYIYDLYLVSEFPNENYGLYFKVIHPPYPLIIHYKDDFLPEIVLKDEVTRQFFLDYFQERYCRNKYPSMQAWHQQQIDWHTEDMNW